MTDPRRPSSGQLRRRTPRFASLLAVAATALVALAGCGGSPSPSQSPSSTASRQPSTSVGDIDHPTGATTVILRVDEGGGFVAPGFLVTEAPQFSLYGDGTAIFRDPSSQSFGELGQIVRGVPFQAVRLSEDEIQSLLAFALGPGALGIAREQYMLPVADAPTTTFTIVAGGLDKTVSVNGLGIGADAGPDTAALNALANLRARLIGFGGSVGGETPWSPDRYRGILMDTFGGGDQPGELQDWPWPDIEPSDFTAADPDASSWLTRVMTPTEVEALGIDGFEGGLQGVLLSRPKGAPEGMPYEFSLRPLLPDETQ